MMEWVKGEIIGRGSFGTVNLATPRRDFSEIPPLMAVKSSLVSQSAMLQKEKEILTHLNGCPQILRCFGDDLTIENGLKIYNIFLEFAAKGNLSQLIKSSSGNSIPESDIRRYTKSITQGLNFIHRQGYVHSDIKPQNILLCSSSSSGKQSEVKIADFGLAKKAGQKSRVLGLIGTPLYMSPESISCNENEAPSDVWALGCVVIEMITGKTAWNCKANADVSNLLFRIGFSEESPEIPEELSEQGKDFLKKCLMRDPKKRWTAKMLLDHPFIATAAADDDKTVPLPGLEKSFPSPRSAFDFPESWNSSHLSSVQGSNSDSNNSFRGEFDELNCSSTSSCLTDRIRELGMGQEPNWASSDSWVVVRKTESSVS